MFCEKCGAQLPDDAKFCEKCGSSTEPGAAPAPAAAAVAAAAAPAAPQAPSAFSLALKKFFSNKRNVIISAVALLLVIAAIVTIIIIASQPRKIYIDDYFHVVFEGVDGSGRAYLNVSEKENEKMKKLNKKLFGDDADEESIDKYLTPYIDMTEEELNTLKNGQKIKIKLKINKEIYDEVDGYKFVLRHKTVKVKGLYKSTQLNVLDYITPVFDGYDGYGMPQTLDTLVFPLINGTEARVTHQGHQLRIELYETKSDSYISTVYARFDRYDHLSNGDTVNLSINASDYDTSSLYSGYGLILASQTRSYTVDGLEVPTTFDLTKHIKFNFTGMSTLAAMNFEVPANAVTFEGHSVTIINYNANSEYSGSFEIQLRNANGDSIRNFTYYADKCTKLQNGNKVKFETSASTESILGSCGISFPQSFEIEVSGLTEPFNADPVSRGTYSFEGYEGYGSFIYNLPEDKCIYKTDDGKYTIKLTFKNLATYYRINVIVADANGRNFISFNYDSNSITYLSNNSIIEFYSSLWDSEIESYVRDYGLYFPDSVKFDVEGLKPITTVKPLDNLTFSFKKGADDYITMTLGLTEKTITVGDNTVNLELTNYTSYGTKYTKLVLTVKNKDGKKIGTGYYEFQTNYLYEGQNIWANSNMPDYDTIAKGAGIIFSTEGFSAFVSAN